MARIMPSQVIQTIDELFPHAAKPSSRAMLLMLWTAPPRHIGAMDVGAVEAPTIQRSEPCRR